jgi:hypothetical protein
LGWDVLALVKGPTIFSNSLEKRIIPRAPHCAISAEERFARKECKLNLFIWSV